MRLETDAANNAAPLKRGVRRLTVSTSRVLWTFALSSGALLTCSAPLSSQSLIGRTTAELSAGDYVLPRFSPSGRFLVVSQVLADTATENTQILLLDLGRGLLDTLLPAKAAAKYATYKSYVSDFRWMGDTILHASIPDGDVGVTEVALDVRSRSILHEEHQEGGDEDPLAPCRALADSLGHLYPGVAPPGASANDVFGSGLSWPMVHGRAFVLLQKRFAGVDDDVWLYRLDRREAILVLPLTGGVRASLAGGFVAGRDLIFAAGTDTLTLYRYRNARLTTLVSVPVKPQASSLSLRAQRRDSVWFVLTLHPSYERGGNRVFLYDGERLRSLGDYQELVDADVHLVRHRIAFLYRDGGQRHVVVKELLLK